MGEENWPIDALLDALSVRVTLQNYEEKAMSQGAEGGGLRGNRDG
jgi:hypothetical protein